MEALKIICFSIVMVIATIAFGVIFGGIFEKGDEGIIYTMETQKTIRHVATESKETIMGVVFVAFGAAVIGLIVMGYVYNPNNSETEYKPQITAKVKQDYLPKRSDEDQALINFAADIVNTRQGLLEHERRKPVQRG